MRLAFVIISGMVAMGASTVARADTLAMLDVPASNAAFTLPNGASFSDEVTDHATELGNELGHHMDLLTHDVMSLQFDGRARHARMRLGTGENTRRVAFSIDNDIQFVGTEAHVKTHIDLAFANHKLHVDLPEFEVMPQSYQGDRVVVFLVPFLARRW